MKIVVTWNCQTAGLCLALQKIFSNDLISPFPTPDSTDAIKSNELCELIESCDFWLTDGKFNYAPTERVCLIKIPSVLFRGFHPDVCYAKSKLTGDYTKNHWNSRIVVWAYNNNIDSKSALNLFNSKVYSELLYYDTWQKSYDELRSSFIKCDISNEDFNALFLSLKRDGIFMYGINHPKQNLIVGLALLLAKKIDPNYSVSNSFKFKIPDTVPIPVWPVYSEIAENMGFNSGGYNWIFLDKIINGPMDYINFSFTQYQNQGILPTELVPDIEFSESANKILEGMI